MFHHIRFFNRRLENNWQSCWVCLLKQNFTNQLKGSRMNTPTTRQPKPLSVTSSNRWASDFLKCGTKHFNTTHVFGVIQHKTHILCIKTQHWISNMEPSWSQCICEPGCRQHVLASILSKHFKMVDERSPGSNSMLPETRLRNSLPDTNANNRGGPEHCS